MRLVRNDRPVRVAWTVGAAYFAVVFALGFALGTARELLLVRAGVDRLVAVGIELPIAIGRRWAQWRSCC